MSDIDKCQFCGAGRATSGFLCGTGVVTDLQTTACRIAERDKLKAELAAKDAEINRLKTSMLEFDGVANLLLFACKESLPLAIQMEGSSDFYGVEDALRGAIHAAHAAKENTND